MLGRAEGCFVYLERMKMKIDWKSQGYFEELFWRAILKSFLFDEFRRQPSCFTPPAQGALGD